MRVALLAATAAIALAAGLPPPAHATLMVSASVNGTTVLTCADNAIASAACPGGDTNPAIGTLALAPFSGSGISLTGSSQSSVGTPANPNVLDILNTSFLNIMNTSGLTALIEASVGDTSFKGPASAFSISNSGTWQTAVGSSITTDFFDDPANAQGGLTPTSHPGTSVASFSSTAVNQADAYSNSLTGSLANAGDFSMSQHFLLSLTTGGQLVNRGSTQLVTPTGVSEPGTLGLLGAGLIGTGFLVRRRKVRGDDNLGNMAVA